MEARKRNDPAVERDNGSGTVTLPPPTSRYVSPRDLHMMIAGLPPGTTIEIAPEHRGFFCLNNPCGRPGGSLGGEIEEFGSTLVLRMNGTGELDSFQRTIELPVAVETHTGPRDPVSGEQRFDTDMFMIQGFIAGDPDFDFLQVTGGTGNGLPSPGHTVLTDQGDGTFQVDSFFDITYQISFDGAPGGQLDGLGGGMITPGTVRVSAAFDPFLIFTDGFESGDVTVWSSSVGNPP